MGKILNNIKSKQKQLVELYKNVCFESLSSEFPQYLNRIFKEGGATQGEIGKYSTKTIYVGASNFRNKTTANQYLGSKKKRAGLDWITTKEGKHLVAIQGGYKMFRKMNGLQDGRVDLNFRGDLFRAVVIVNNGDGSASIRINNQKQYQIARANEKHFNRPIFYPTNKERNNMYKFINKQFIEK